MSIKIFNCNFIVLRHILTCFILLGIVLIYKKKNKNSYNDALEDISKSVIQLPIISENRNNLDNSKILNFIQSLNKEENIQNYDSFGSIAEDTIILVILLDKFSSSFKYIISSLSQVSGIEEVLIIFSHSYFDENLNSVIKNIEFCRVLQIYYPYSIQTHPKEFPGYDPTDCPYETNSKSSGLNCTGSLFLDVRGRFRNPLSAERKHHWWWTANNVFENLSSTARHTGLVIFSEDNFIFMKDFIYMASYMKNVADSLPQCEFLSLGSDTTPAYKEVEPVDLYSVELSSWSPKIHSRVLAFDKSVWNSIVSHYDVFCIIDDASWLRSLYYISIHRRDGKRLKTISAATPRAFKIDTCAPDFFGFFGYRCDLLKNNLRVTRFQKLNDENLFPPHLELYINVELEDEEDIIFDYSESDGGWADPRDWGLCRNMTAGKMKKILMEMRNEFHEYFGGKSGKI